MNEFLPIFGAAAGGALPAIAWLWFWLREDRKHPEPRQLIALAFFMGMVTVALAIPLQKAAAVYVTGTVVFVAWSFIEEMLKYLVASATLLWRREVDEPIDTVMYMIAIALGFAAVENALFLLSPLGGEGFWNTLLTGNLRFVGATLLHVLSSAIVGVFVALAFYKRPSTRFVYGLAGVIVAAAVHSAFNVFIVESTGETLLRTFAGVWVGVVGILALLEYVKYVRRCRI